MSIQTQTKAWLADLGFPYNFPEFEEMCREVELIGAEAMVNEYASEFGERYNLDEEDKAHLRKSVFAIYWASESSDDGPEIALTWLAQVFDEFFLVRGAREAYGLAYQNIYEFINLASWLAHQGGECLTYENFEGYHLTQKIASLATWHTDNLSDGILVSKKMREVSKSCVFDTFGDPNTTLTFIAGLLQCPETGLLRLPEIGDRTLPSIEHVVEEMRLCSKTGLNSLFPEELIYNRIRSSESDVDLWNTAFDLSFWEEDEEALKLFEAAVNQILDENNRKVKPQFQRSKIDRFKILNLHQFEAELNS